MITSKVFTNVNGSTKIFSSDFIIPLPSYAQVLVNGSVVDTADYDVINNAIVFETAPASGSEVIVRVGTSPDDLETPNSSIEIVASNINDINLIEDNIEDIVVNANSISSINTNANNIDSINTVATVGADGLTGIVNNINNISTVAGIYPQVQAVASNANAIANINSNLTEILLTDDKATIATEKATIATEKATIATEKATIATEQALIASTQAGVANAKANEASDSAAAAALSESNASLYASTAFNSATTATSAANSATSSASTATDQATIATNKANEAAQLLGQLQELGLVTQSSQLFAAQGGTNEVFTLNNEYTVGSIYVYREGFLLTPNEYIATDGTTVTILGDTTAGESIYVMSFGTVGVISLPDALTPSDIGSLVQAYNSATVIDANYATTISGIESDIASIENDIDNIENDITSIESDIASITTLIDNNNIVSVLDYGADPTGATNSSTAFQNALDNNAKVYVPVGKYLLSSPIRLKQDNTLYGDSVMSDASVVRNNDGTPLANTTVSSTLLLSGATIEFDIDSTLDSLVIINNNQFNVAYSSRTLANYNGNAITAIGDSRKVVVNNCGIYGFDTALYSTYNSGQTVFKNNRIDCLTAVKFAGDNYDVCYFENNHMWPFYSTGIASTTVNNTAYSRNVMFDIDRVDWLQITNCFSHSVKQFLKCDDAIGGGSIVGGGYDYECYYDGTTTYPDNKTIGIEYSTTNPSAGGLKIANMSFNGGYRHLDINFQNGDALRDMMSITGCIFARPADEALRINGGVVMMSSCGFSTFSTGPQRTKRLGTIDGSVTTRLAITGCTFGYVTETTTGITGMARFNVLNSPLIAQAANIEL